MNTQAATTANTTTPACFYDRAADERLLRGRHVTGWEINPEHGPLDGDDACQGCEPCPADHCTVCRKEHVEHVTVCPGCIVNARRRIRLLYVLWKNLVGETRNGGSEGRLNASRPILGGDAMVYAAAGSAGDEVGKREAKNEIVAALGLAAGVLPGAGDVSHKDDESTTEAIPTVKLLRDWEQVWSEQQNRALPADRDRPLLFTARYLRDQTSWAARNVDSFPDYVRELGGHMAVLESILHAGVRPDLGSAPCFDCAGILQRMPRDAKPCEHARLAKKVADHYDEPTFTVQHLLAYLERWNPKVLWEHRNCDQGGHGDRYFCTSCDRRYDAPHYWLAVRARMIDHTPTAADVSANRRAGREAKVRAEIAAATAEPTAWQQTDLDRLNGGRP